MNGSRIGTLATGFALMGLGGMLVLRALESDDGGDRYGESNEGASVPYGEGTRVVKVFTINAPAAELYDYWRDFTNLPTFMPHLDRVEVDGERSTWHATTNLHAPVAWEAEVIADVPNERIAWRSVGGPFHNAGSVTFRPAPGERGTEVRAEIAWSAGGPARTQLVKLLGQDPALAIESDLRRFKSLMEAGDVALNGTDVTK